MDLPSYFLNVIWPVEDFFFGNFFFEKAKHSQICISFSGNLPEAKIWKVPDNPSLIPPY